MAKKTGTSGTASKSSNKARCFSGTIFLSAQYPKAYWYTYLKCKKKYVYQLESCPSTGTLHIQYMFYESNPRNIDAVIKEIDIEKTAGKNLCEKSKKALHGFVYCTKRETRKEGPFYSLNWEADFYTHIEYTIDLIDEFSTWQKELINYLDEKPEKRIIRWYVDFNGRMGKSDFAKWAVLNINCISIDSGKKADIKFAVERWKNKEHLTILFDIPRDSHFVQYNVLESLKNGMFLSTKYESKMVVFPTPHVIVFSNEEPNLSRMSRDRWKVIYLDNLTEKVDKPMDMFDDENELDFN